MQTEGNRGQFRGIVRIARSRSQVAEDGETVALIEEAKGSRVMPRDERQFVVVRTGSGVPFGHQRPGVVHVISSRSAWSMITILITRTPRDSDAHEGLILGSIA